MRSYEIDSQGIVHNAVYLQYFELARFEYLRKIGYEKDFASVVEGTRVVLVRNEIDYTSSARFDDPLDIYTRISSFGRTSFIFEGFIKNSKTGKSVSRNTAVHVWLDPDTGKPVPVPRGFTRRVGAFEGKKIARKSLKSGDSK